MKAKLLFLAVVAVVGSAVAWMILRHPSVSASVDSGGRKVLYYTCSMHPWVHESKPGQCPVCGMNLTPVYADDANAPTTTNANGVTLESDSVSAIGLQTDTVQRQPVQRSLHFSGQISWNSSQAAWFEFTAYQRDLAWLKIGQTLQVNVSGLPGKTFTAQIKAHGAQPFADTDFNMLSSSTTLRAEIANPPVEVGDLGKYKLFNGLHAEATLVAATEPTLAIPRTAVISRGYGAMVYVDTGDNHYEARPVQLGRTGDQLVEVLNGLKPGEKVVTTGNVLIDSEAQLTAGQ
jgi:multidrug efflux pump subunit AcrA (membrane-fusion protein)